MEIDAILRFFDVVLLTKTSVILPTLIRLKSKSSFYFWLRARKRDIRNSSSIIRQALCSFVSWKTSGMIPVGTRYTPTIAHSHKESIHSPASIQNESNHVAAGSIIPAAAHLPATSTHHGKAQAQPKSDTIQPAISPPSSIIPQNKHSIPKPKPPAHRRTRTPPNQILHRAPPRHPQKCRCRNQSQRNGNHQRRPTRHPNSLEPIPQNNPFQQSHPTPQRLLRFIRFPRRMDQKWSGRYRSLNLRLGIQVPRRNGTLFHQFSPFDIGSIIPVRRRSQY